MVVLSITAAVSNCHRITDPAEQHQVLGAQHLVGSTAGSTEQSFFNNM